MPHAILTKVVAGSFTLSLSPAGTGIADGVARQGDRIQNSGNYPAAIVYIKVTSGGVAPTAGRSYDVFLLRYNTALTFADDNAGASDAAITIENAPFLGSIFVTATTAKGFWRSFDTSKLGPLGAYWTIAIRNSSGQAVSNTEADHLKLYSYYYPEVQ